jgi:hypothetical protein
MPFTLTSKQTSGPLVLILPSGTTVRLGPGQTSPELPDVDVLDNPKLTRLRQLGVLEVVPVETKAGAGSRSRRAKGSTEAKGSPEAKASAETAADSKTT